MQSPSEYQSLCNSVNVINAIKNILSFKTQLRTLNCKVVAAPESVYPMSSQNWGFHVISTNLSSFQSPQTSLKKHG